MNHSSPMFNQNVQYWSESSKLWNNRNAHPITINRISNSCLANSFNIFKIFGASAAIVSLQSYILCLFVLTSVMLFSCGYTFFPYSLINCQQSAILHYQTTDGITPFLSCYLSSVLWLSFLFLGIWAPSEKNGNRVNQAWRNLKTHLFTKHHKKTAY